MVDDPLAPVIDEQTRRDAQREMSVAYGWVTNILICCDCGGFNLVSYCGVRKEIADDGFPVDEMCHHCDETTRQYDVHGLDWRQ